jgi:hypothetical protein
MLRAPSNADGIAMARIAGAEPAMKPTGTGHTRQLLLVGQVEYILVNLRSSKAVSGRGRNWKLADFRSAPWHPPFSFSHFYASGRNHAEPNT